MIYAIIILAICVIITFAVGKYDKKDWFDSLISLDDRMEKKISTVVSIGILEMDEKLRQYKIDSIIGKDNQFISLLKQAKEKGYFDKPFSPFNLSTKQVFKGDRAYIESNIMGDCLFISSTMYWSYGTFPYQPYRYTENISCIYQNGRWAEIVEEQNMFDAAINSIKKEEVEQKEYKPENEFLSSLTTKEILDKIVKCYPDDEAIKRRIASLKKYIEKTKNAK